MSEQNELNQDAAEQVAFEHEMQTGERLTPIDEATARKLRVHDQLVEALKSCRMRLWTRRGNEYFTTKDHEAMNQASTALLRAAKGE